MKKVRTNLFKALFIASVSVVALSSCQKEAEVLPAPTVTATSSLSGIVGATVSVKATINAPAGIKSIVVLKNGVAFDSKTYTGEKTAEYAKDYVIENLAAGSNVNFTIQVTDQNGQVSALTAVGVTVTATPPKTIVEVRYD
jgi:hypothetical protein